MPKPATDEAMVQLATRIPASLLQQIKIHCIERDQTIMEFLADALRERLRRSGVRLVALLMSVFGVLAA